MKKRILLLVLAILVFAGSGCLNKSGSLVLHISTEGVEMQTLLPDVDMTIATYEVIGVGPGGASFNEVDVTGATLTKEALAFGEWVITVYAKNIDGIVIGEGTESVIVHVGETSNVNITVKPQEGTGILDLTIQWNGEDTEVPTINSQLIPPIGSMINLNFILSNGDTGTCLKSDLATGYYSLVVQLMDNGILTMGTVEVVRIVKDQTTSGLFEFYNINEPGGNIVVGITPEMDDPIPVELMNQPESLVTTDKAVVTAVIPPEVGNAVYVWYLNGESVATGQTYTIEGMEAGIYQLDVTVFTVDGKRGGSAGCCFTVVDDEALTNGWIKTYGSYFQDETYDLASVSTGGIVTGGVRNNIATMTDIIVYRIDENGTLLWGKTIIGHNEDRCFGVLSTWDGNIVLSGYSDSWDFSGALLIKLDDSGNILWSKCWRQGGYAIFSDIVQSADGGYLAVGCSYESTMDGLVIKLDSLGETEWVWVCDTTKVEELKFVEETSDHGYIIGGTVCNPDLLYDGLIIKIDQFGNEEWSIILEGGYDDFLQDIHQTNDGGYIATGIIREGSMITEGFALKLDSLGNVEWTKTYKAEFDGIRAMAIAETSDGYVLSGNHMVPGAYYAVLMKTDVLGNLQWGVEFDTELSSNDSITILESLDSGGLLGAGFTTIGVGSLDTLLIKSNDLTNAPSLEMLKPISITEGTKIFTITQPNLQWSYSTQQTVDQTFTTEDENLVTKLICY